MNQGHKNPTEEEARIRSRGMKCRFQLGRRCTGKAIGSHSERRRSTLNQMPPSLLHAAAHHPVGRPMNRLTYWLIGWCGFDTQRCSECADVHLADVMYKNRPSCLDGLAVPLQVSTCFCEKYLQCNYNQASHPILRQNFAGCGHPLSHPLVMDRRIN